MVILELFETGLFDMFLHFSEPLVWKPAYFCLLLGLCIQFALLKKSQKRLWRLLIPGFGFLGIVICECMWHFSTGWDRLIVDMICLLLISLLLGSMIAVVLSLLKAMIKRSQG